MVLVPNPGSWPQLFMAAAHPGVKYAIVGIGGTTFDERATINAYDRIDRYAEKYGNARLVIDAGFSDIDRALLTAAQLRDKYAAYADARRAAGFGHITGLTVNRGSDAWYDATGQATRLAVNDMMRADPEAFGFDVLVDIDAVPELADPLDATYRYDGLHYTAAGAAEHAQAVASAGV
jgi:hypothetical protein